MAEKQVKRNIRLVKIIQWKYKQKKEGKNRTEQLRAMR